jgi:hypothetical protein
VQSPDDIQLSSAVYLRVKCERDGMGEPRKVRSEFRLPSRVPAWRQDSAVDAVISGFPRPALSPRFTGPGTEAAEHAAVMNNVMFSNSP